MGSPRIDASPRAARPESAQRAARRLLRERVAALRPLTRRHRTDERRVHQTRVALRRLREVLSSVSPMLPSGRLRDCDSRIRRALKRLGAVRDADAALGWCVAAIPQVTEAAERAVLFRLIAGLEEERARAQERLESARLRIRRIRAEVRALAGRVGATEETGARYFSRALAVGRARLLAEAGNAGGAEDRGGLHAVRLRAKHLRYVAEAYPGIRAAESVAETCAGLQEILGEFHDLDLLSARLGVMLPYLADPAERAGAMALRLRWRYRMGDLESRARGLLEAFAEREVPEAGPGVAERRCSGRSAG